MSNNVPEFLEHYGVKGMRWGVRRDPKTGARPIAVTLNNSRFGRTANRRARAYGRKQDAKLYGKATIAKAKATGGAGGEIARAKQRAKTAKAEAKAKNRLEKGKKPKLTKAQADKEFGDSVTALVLKSAKDKTFVSVTVNNRTTIMTGQEAVNSILASGGRIPKKAIFKELTIDDFK